MPNQDRVFAIRVFSHRALWNGTVCRSAADWDCGATANFRTEFCAQGVERCFHRNLYVPTAPRLAINEVPGDELFAGNPSALNDQVVVFFSRKFVEPNGNQVREHEFIHGVFRMRQVTKEAHGHRHQWVLEPHEGEWFTIPVNLLRTPSFDRLNAFLFSFQRATLTALIEEQKGEIMEARSGAFFGEEEQRRARGLERLESWIDAAPATPFFDGNLGRTYKLPSEVPLKPALAAAFEGAMKGTKQKVRTAIPIAAAPLDSAPNAVIVKAPSPAAAVDVPPPSAIPTVAAYVRHSIPESEAAARLASIYGDQLVRRLTLAFATKDIVVLTGPPGTGKSRLAVSLLDDLAGERRLVVPVASTWRGREDLLGYVNPVTGLFEPTAFTDFLFRAEEAWRSGDRAPRLVLFEEFNLSQPEHWLSDLLVRLEYSHESEEDRTIDLGGSGVRGRDSHVPKVFLAPSLVVVATVNNDHTVKELSPRVLDRSALVEVTLTPRAALSRAGVSMPEEVIIATERLNEVLRTRGIAFSIRSALSVKNARERAAHLQLSEVDALDHVLVQEVLSKLRLFADDPRDVEVVAALKDWAGSQVSKQLPLACEQIAKWAEDIDSGIDVLQA